TSTQGLNPYVRKQLMAEISNIPDDQYIGDDSMALFMGRHNLSATMTERALKQAQTSEATQKAAQAGAEAQKTQAETANLPSPQDAAAQRAATLASTQATTGKTRVETAKAAEELSQLKRQAASIGAPDPTGFSSSLPVAEYNKRYDAFAKSKG